MLTDIEIAELAAFKVYQESVDRLQKDCSFENARAAKSAWIDFVNVGLPDHKKLWPLNMYAFPTVRVLSASLSGPQSAA